MFLVVYCIIVGVKIKVYYKGVFVASIIFLITEKLANIVICLIIISIFRSKQWAKFASQREMCIRDSQKPYYIKVCTISFSKYYSQFMFIISNTHYSAYDNHLVIFTPQSRESENCVWNQITVTIFQKQNEDKDKNRSFFISP